MTAEFNSDESQKRTEASFVTDAILVFAHQYAQIRTIIVRDIVVLDSRMSSDDALRIFRCYRDENGNLSQEESNVTAKSFDRSLLLSDLYLNNTFGICIALDSERARFELKSRKDSDPDPVLEYLTLEGKSVHLQFDYVRV